MSNLTKEQIEEIFRKSRERQAKLREQEAQNKAAERLRKNKARKQQARLEKEAQKAKEEAELEAYRENIRQDVKPSRWIQDSPTNNLYSKYELEHIEELYPNETGRLSKKYWLLIEKVKKELQEWEEATQG